MSSYQATVVVSFTKINHANVLTSAHGHSFAVCIQPAVQCSQSDLFSRYILRPHRTAKYSK